MSIKIEDAQKILEFTHTLSGVKKLLRFKGMPYWEDADWERWDSVAEHSYRMAMLAILISPYLETPVNLERVLKMTLIHDIVELITNDHSPMAKHLDGGGHAFDPKAFADKYERETKAAEFIFKDLPGETRGEFVDLFREYIDTKAFPKTATPEGKFAYALDKIEAVIQIIDWRTPKSNWPQEHYEKSITYMNEWGSYDPFLAKICGLIQQEGIKIVSTT
ncbi:MAG: HD domain-containing protein [Patescibacteria group bacterium]